MPLMRSRLLPKLPWKALYFDGVDDYVLLPRDLGLGGGHHVWFEAFVWIEPSSSGRARIIADIWAHRHSLRIVADDRVQYFYSPEPGTYYYVFSYTALRLGRWVHIVAGRSYDKIYFYIDGVLNHTEEKVDIATPVTTADNVIGAESSKAKYFFGGYIAMLRIYSRALTEDEVRWNYYHPDDPVRDGLVLWLHYDSIDEENGIWRDKSPYGNHGTIYGATPVEFTKPPYRLSTPVRLLSPVR